MREHASRASSRRQGKARVHKILHDAREGDLRARALASTAYRVRIARLAAGHDDDEENAEAEAGALLEAEEAFNLHRLCEMYAEVHKSTH